MTRRHAALGVLVGLLLALPLVLLSVSVTQARLGKRPPREASVSPVLGFDERLRLVTYQRECRKGADCEAPLGCLYDMRVFGRYCIDSECTTDEQCPEGQTCQRLPTLDGGPLVRYCIPLGVRQEGEKCFRPPRDKAVACAPGLVCAGATKNWCGSPCDGARKASCPEGFFCADVAPEPVCLPTCEARGCPEGQQCIRYEEGVSRCARVYGPNCQRSPCSNGQRCAVLDPAEQPDTVWMECIEECRREPPHCTAGLVCDAAQCMRPCDPQVPAACGEGFQCGQRKPETPWVCQPELNRERGLPSSGTSRASTQDGGQ